MLLSMLYPVKHATPPYHVHLLTMHTRALLHLPAVHTPFTPLPRYPLSPCYTPFTPLPCHPLTTLPLTTLFLTMLHLPFNRCARGGLRPILRRAPGRGTLRGAGAL
eukprot:scaffold34373_cov60-Phaeocystis_antarctica.AAC.4